MRRGLPLLLLAAACANGQPAAGQGSGGQARRTQASLMTDWAVARCLAKGFGLKTQAGADAARGAAALLERGDRGIDAYEAVERMVDRQLARPYAGSTGGSYTTLKCLDLRHAPELARLIRSQKPGAAAR